MAHLVDVARLAYPDARFVHIIRDGRDVVSSLLEKRWLRPTEAGEDDAGIAYGTYARFWVEPDRREEFSSVSDARRGAWAWRRYVTAARAARAEVFELRYEQLVSEPDAAAAKLALHLDVSPDTVAHALGHARPSSVGRFRRDLSEEQLSDVMAEAGDLVRELGYAAEKRRQSPTGDSSPV
jgi:hypothetical protein